VSLQATALEIGIAASILAGSCGVTWFAAAAHYSKDYSTLTGEVKQAGADSLKVEKTKEAGNAAATAEVNDEAKQQISDMAGTITALLLRKPAAVVVTRSVCAAPAGPVRPYLDPVGPAITASDRQPAAAARPDLEIGIARDTIVPALDVGLDALKAELLLREYLRKTGQVK
jgi:hypothetical protein